jgi:Cu2+-exporting ATPase
MCCAGCQAVAQAIVANGLDDYYRHRDALPESPREALPAVLGGPTFYDAPDVQRNLVRPLSEHEREASLFLEGITCAACVWLNEQHLTRQAGVRRWTSITPPGAPGCAGTSGGSGSPASSPPLPPSATAPIPTMPPAEEIARASGAMRCGACAVAGFGMMQVMMYACAGVRGRRWRHERRHRRADALGQPR